MTIGSENLGVAVKVGCLARVLEMEKGGLQGRNRRDSPVHQATIDGGIPPGMGKSQ
jgi:hypothetical protein